MLSSHRLSTLILDDIQEKSVCLSLNFHNLAPFKTELNILIQQYECFLCEKVLGGILGYNKGALSLAPDADLTATPQLSEKSFLLEHG